MPLCGSRLPGFPDSVFSLQKGDTYSYPFTLPYPNGEVNGQEIPHLCVPCPCAGPPVACCRDALDHDPDPMASPHRGRGGRRLDSEPLHKRLTAYRGEGHYVFRASKSDGPSVFRHVGLRGRVVQIIRELSREYYIRVFDRGFTILFHSPPKRDGQGPKGGFPRSCESSLAEGGQIRVKGAGYG